jgi:2-oxoglutarate ferredoxin oxidoreductase subunit alpha
LAPEELEAKTRARFERYETIKAAETQFEYAGSGASILLKGPAASAWEAPADTDLTLVAYGTSARVCLGAKMLAEKEGIKLGIYRPVTLWPFPCEGLGKIAAKGKPILTVEMSLGQLVEDVRLAACGRAPVHLLGHSGGVIPTEEEVFARAKNIIKGLKEAS